MKAVITETVITETVAMESADARDARLREAVRAVLLGSQLERETFAEALEAARQMPELEQLFRSPRGGVHMRGELLVVVVWIWVLVRSGAVPSTLNLTEAKQDALTVAQAILGDERTNDTARKLYSQTRLGTSDDMFKRVWTLQGVGGLGAHKDGGVDASRCNHDALYLILHPAMRAAIHALGLSASPETLVVPQELLDLVAVGMDAAADDSTPAVTQPLLQTQPQQQLQPLAASQPAVASQLLQPLLPAALRPTASQPLQADVSPPPPQAAPPPSERRTRAVTRAAATRAATRAATTAASPASRTGRPRRRAATATRLQP